jgi:hypothetical protein
MAHSNRQCHLFMSTYLKVCSLLFGQLRGNREWIETLPYSQLPTAHSPFSVIKP